LPAETTDLLVPNGILAFVEEHCGLMIPEAFAPAKLSADEKAGECGNSRTKAHTLGLPRAVVEI
jgi:hypothetical protein